MFLILIEFQEQKLILTFDYSTQAEAEEIFHGLEKPGNWPAGASSAKLLHTARYGQYHVLDTITKD